MPRCCHSSGLRCLYGPIVHIRRLHVEQVADANSAGASCELACDRRLRHAGACRHEGAAPAEPVEVDGEVLGGNALETRHERIEERVDGVDAFDRASRPALGAVGLMGSDVELGQHVNVGMSLVGGDDRAGADSAAQGVHGALFREVAAPRHLEEHGIGVAHPRHDADLLARQPSLVDLLAAAMGFPRHPEGALGAIALERLGEVCLVKLARASFPDVEPGRVRLQALDEPVAHGVGGLEAYAAAGRAFAERKRQHEALGIGHPGLEGQLARVEDSVGGAGERPAVIVAEIPLLAVLGLALLHDGDRTAAGTALDFIAVACSVVEHGSADDVLDGFDCTATLGLAERRRVLLEGDDQIFGVHDAPMP